MSDLTYIGNFPQMNPYGAVSAYAPASPAFSAPSAQVSFTAEASFFSSMLNVQQNLASGWGGFGGSIFPAPTFGAAASANSLATSHFVNPGFGNQFINPGFHNQAGNNGSLNFGGLQLGHLNAFSGIGGQFGGSIFPTPSFGFDASAGSLNTSHFVNPGFSNQFVNPGFQNPLGNFGSALSNPAFTAFNTPGFGTGGGHPGFINMGGPPNLHTTLPMPPMFSIGIL